MISRKGTPTSRKSGCKHFFQKRVGTGALEPLSNETKATLIALNNPINNCLLPSSDGRRTIFFPRHYHHPLMRNCAHCVHATVTDEITLNEIVGLPAPLFFLVRFSFFRRFCFFIQFFSLFLPANAATESFTQPLTMVL